MTNPEVEALRKVMTQINLLLADVISAIIVACNERQSIDTDKLRSVFENLVSRPDVDVLDRALLERMLKAFP